MLANKMKLKDIFLIALITALYIIIYFISMGASSVLGSFGHAISPGFQGLFAGSTVYFLSRKVGKFGQYSLLTLLVMGIFAMMGGGYLPWFISSMVTAIIADLIASRSKDTSVLNLAIASGIMHVGQAWGAIIPSWFFLERYKETWLQRGQTEEVMNEFIKYTAGMWGVVATVLTFVLAFIGIYIAYFILKSHIEKKND